MNAVAEKPRQATKTAPAVEASRSRTASAKELGYIHRAQDIETVFQAIGAQCISLRDFLKHARKELEEDRGHLLTINNLQIAEHLVCLIGAMSDQMSECPTLGSTADWVTGDGIDRIADGSGGAGE